MPHHIPVVGIAILGQREFRNRNLRRRRRAGLLRQVPTSHHWARSTGPVTPSAMHSFAEILPTILRALDPDPVGSEEFFVLVNFWG